MPAAIDTNFAVLSAPLITDKKKFLSVLGFCNVYWRFIKEYEKREGKLN